MLEHAIRHGDLTAEQDHESERAIAVSAAIALLVHWGTVRDRPITDDDIEQTVDGVLLPLP